MITLRLDKNGGINKGDVQAFEHDNKSEVYIIQLYKNGEIYDLTNKSIELTMVERKRKIGDMVSLPIYEATEGKVKLEVVSDITKQDGIYDFKLTVKDTTGLIETFPNFQVEIKNDITDSITGEIIQDPNFTILTEGLKALADYNIYKTNALKVPDIEQDIVEINEQLDNTTNKIESIEINLAFPPVPFEGIKNNEDITNKLQTIISNLGSNKKYIIPFGSYILSNSFIMKNLNNIKLIGLDCTINLKGVDTTFFTPNGTNNNVEICGFNIIGSNNLNDNQAFINNLSGQFNSNFHIHNNKIKNLVLGISLNANISGYFKDSIIENNIIDNIIGENAGQGYGIHVSNNDYDLYSNIIIRNNIISNCQRHSIYVARGSGYKIEENTILNHRIGLSSSIIRPAISISRSCNVDVIRNNIYNTNSVDIGIFGLDNSTIEMYNINVEKNTCLDCSFSSINVEIISNSSSNINFINIKDNFIKSKGNIVTLYAGKNITIENNKGYSSGHCFVLNLNEKTNNILFGNNNFKNNSTSGMLFRINNDIATSLKFINNNGENYSAYFNSNVTLTLPSIFVENQDITGLYITPVKKDVNSDLYVAKTLITKNYRYTNPPLKLGDYYLWCTTNGVLRIKKGTPTSELDGTVVGSQT